MKMKLRIAKLGYSAVNSVSNFLQQIEIKLALKINHAAKRLCNESINFVEHATSE